MNKNMRKEMGSMKFWGCLKDFTSLGGPEFLSLNLSINLFINSPLSFLFHNSCRYSVSFYLQCSKADMKSVEFETILSITSSKLGSLKISSFKESEPLKILQFCCFLSETSFLLILSTSSLEK